MHLYAQTAAGIDPATVLLIHKAESIGDVASNQREWEINWSDWYFAAQIDTVVKSHPTHYRSQQNTT